MKQFVLLFSMILLLGTITKAQKPVEISEEKEAIIKIIESSYQDGLNNYGDVEAIQKGFHPGFNLLMLQKNHLNKLPIYNWIEMVEERKANGYYPVREKVTFQFPLIDISGTAAIAKVEFFKGEKHLFTDYLSLYKFQEGWKIVSKIYYQIPEKE